MEFEMSEKGNRKLIPVTLNDELKESDEWSKLLTNSPPQRASTRKQPPGRSQNLSTTAGFRFKFPSPPHKHQTKAILKGKRGKESLGIVNVLAAQTLKIASINGLGELDKLENDLEEEINFENKSNAKTVIGRLRREGHHHLHSKVVLFLVVILNIIDCLLVMGELTLDFHHVSHLLTTKKAMVDSFATEIKDKYSPNLDDLVGEERHVLLQAVLDSSIIWPQRIVTSAVENATLAASQCHSYITAAAQWNSETYDDYVQTLPDSDWTTDQPISQCFQPLVELTTSAEAEEYKLTSFDKPNEKLIIVAHKLHYISVAILSVLVVILLLKIICAGRRFLRSKMAVFDGIVIVISFVVDIVFIKGIHIFSTDDFVIILTFLLPWRIIRVLNSLIAAVLDKQRLNLKIIYTQKKKITRNLTEVNNKVEVMQRQIQILQGLCSSRGITDGDVRKILGTDNKPVKHEKSDSKKNHGGGHGLASMMALGKLAFQAADALAPMPDVKGRSTPTSPVATPIFTKHPLQNQTSTNTNNSTTDTSSNNAEKNGVAHQPVQNGSVPTGTSTVPNPSTNVNGADIPKNGESPQEVNKDKGDNTTTTAPHVKSNGLPPHNSLPSSSSSSSSSSPSSSSSSSSSDKPTDSQTNNKDVEEDYSVSENLDIPEVSESASLDIESAATISMDLRDDDIGASIDDVNVQFEMENETPSVLTNPAVTKGDNHVVNDTNATSRL